MIEPLSNPQIRRFKAAAQLLDPILKVGKAGLSDGFVRSVNEALSQHELVKIKFADFKEQKKELAPQLAAKTASHLIMRVGNVMVLHRPKPEGQPAKPEIRKAEIEPGTGEGTAK
jgi:RNA-binding protein